MSAVRRIRDTLAERGYILSAATRETGTVPGRIVGWDGGGTTLLASPECVVSPAAFGTPEAWDAGIAWNGIADFRGIYDVMAKSRDRIERELGGDGLDRLDELSPISNVDDAGGPFLEETL